MKETLNWDAAADRVRFELDKAGELPHRNGIAAMIEERLLGLKADESWDSARVAALIDHTLLKPEAVKPRFDTLAAEAREQGFCSVCVNSCRVAYCRSLLEKNPVKLASVVGFPLGAMEREAKAFETRRAVADGADEIDMVINIGAAKEGDWPTVAADIAAVRQECGDKVLLKCILETCLLNPDEIERASRTAQEAGAHFVKTSTGFSSGGATIPDVALMRYTVGPEIGVKASGGVRSMEDALAVILAGANRLGTSSGVAIVAGEGGGSGY